MSVRTAASASAREGLLDRPPDGAFKDFELNDLAIPYLRPLSPKAGAGANLNKASTVPPIARSDCKGCATFIGQNPGRHTDKPARTRLRTSRNVPGRALD